MIFYMKTYLQPFVIVSVLFVFLFSNNSEAQYVISTGLGVNKPNYNYADLKAGFSWSLSGSYKVTEQFSAGLLLGYSASRLKTDNDARLRIMPLAATVSYSMTFGKFIPYISGDAGAYFTKTSSPTTSMTPGGWSESPIVYSDVIDHKKTCFGMAPSIGVDYLIMGNLLAGINVKYHFLIKDPTYTSFNVQAGVSYMIGHYFSAKKGKSSKGKKR
jgi:outer membrane protein W